VYSVTQIALTCTNASDIRPEVSPVSLVSRSIRARWLKQPGGSHLLFQQDEPVTTGVTKTPVHVMRRVRRLETVGGAYRGQRPYAEPWMTL
jgi:hypothetical protein